MLRAPSRSGESYAGQYVPNIANYILDNMETELPLKGILVRCLAAVSCLCYCTRTNTRAHTRTHGHTVTHAHMCTRTLVHMITRSTTRAHVTIVVRAARICLSTYVSRRTPLQVGNGCWGGDATNVDCNGPNSEQNDVDMCVVTLPHCVERPSVSFLLCAYRSHCALNSLLSFLSSQLSAIHDDHTHLTLRI